MLVSDIKFTTQEVTIEMPNTDAHAVLMNESHLARFQRDYGNVEIELIRKNNYRQEYKVPSFKEGRDRFSEIKAADCARWGCE